jgi:exocyst complex component 6
MFCALLTFFIIQAQSTLILPFPIPLPQLQSLIQEVTGFFIVEYHVLRTTRGFRSEREVEELWDGTVHRLSDGIDSALENEKVVAPDVFLRVKESVLAFITTMEVCDGSLHSARPTDCI